ncbi:MAG: hybrid sensor histidine kinase/response regulator [Promethearchaeota archaeon]
MDFEIDLNLQIILETLDEGVIITDLFGEVQTCNSNIYTILGMSELDLKTINLFETLNFYQNNQKTSLGFYIEKILKTKEPLILEYPTTIIDQKREEHFVKVSIIPLKKTNSSHEIEGFTIFLFDYTEKYLINQELQKNLRLKSMSRLLSGLAHDFNNIFTTILGNVSLAKFEIPSEGELVNLLEDAEKGIENAREMTKQLLTFSAEEQKEKELVEFPELLNEIVKFTLSGSNITANINFDDNLWPVYLNKTQISLLFHQIIINSVQAMPIGGSIEISASNVTLDENNRFKYNPGSYILIEFQDHGVGIPEEEILHVFDPFFQSEYISQDVNFSTVKNIIDQHFGFIQLHSKLGQGIKIKIYLPAEPMVQVEEEPMFHTETKFSGKILIMDDEEIVRKILKKMLTQLGLEVYTAKNSQETVQIYKEHMRAHDPFKVVILDLTIKGGEGGVLTLQELLRLNPSVKAVASSGYATDKVIVHYQDYGFSGSLVKPYKIEELQKTLSKLY